MCIVFLWISSYRIAFHFNNTGQNLLTITLRNLSHSCLPDEDIHTSKTFQSIKIKITFHLPPAYISFFISFSTSSSSSSTIYLPFADTHIYYIFLFSSTLLFKKETQLPMLLYRRMCPPSYFSFICLAIFYNGSYICAIYRSLSLAMYNNNNTIK